MALHFADTEDTVNTYKDCYNNHLKQIFEEESKKPEEDQDPQLEETMKLVDKFFNQGGFEFLQELESRYECASMCQTPLFYITRNVSVGPPYQDCAHAAIDEMTDNQGAAIVFIVTAVILLSSVYGAFLLCNRTEKEPE